MAAPTDPMVVHGAPIAFDERGDHQIDPLRLWDLVHETPAEFTKEFNRGFKGTAIKPHYLIYRATQVLGPIGVGWGFREVEHKIEHFANGEAIWFSKVKVWWRDRWTNNTLVEDSCEQWGATYLCQQTKAGLRTDDEAAKKAVTDALTKCLSYLGFAADIHLGLFEADSKYTDHGGGGGWGAPAPAQVGGPATGFGAPPPPIAPPAPPPGTLEQQWAGGQGELPPVPPQGGYAPPPAAPPEPPPGPSASDGMTNVGDAARGVAAAQTGMKLPPPEVLKVGPPPIFGPADPAYRVPIDQPRPDNKAGTLQDYIRGKVRGRCAEVGKQRNQDPQEIYDMVKTLLGVEHLMEAHADLLLEGGYVYKLIAAFDEVPF